MTMNQVFLIYKWNGMGWAPSGAGDFESKAAAIAYMTNDEVMGWPLYKVSERVLPVKNLGGNNEMNELIEILDAMASQPKSLVLNIRLSQAERAALDKLAQVYSTDKTALLTDLIRQALIEYYQDGECKALAKK